MSVTHTEATDARLRIANLVIEDQALDYRLAQERIASLEIDNATLVELQHATLDALVTVTADRDRKARELAEARDENRRLLEEHFIRIGAAA